MNDKKKIFEDLTVIVSYAVYFYTGYSGRKNQSGN